MLIGAGGILTSLDKDAAEFIDAAGLNTDSNLNVSGLYTAQHLRLCIDLLFKDLKGIKDTGQALSFFDRNRTSGCGYIYVGGTQNIQKINIFNPSLFTGNFTAGVNSLATGIQSSTGGVFQTGLVPVTVGQGLNNASMTFYSATTGDLGTTSEMGCDTATTGNFLNIRDRFYGNLNNRNNLTTDSAYILTYQRGMFGVGRIASNSFQRYFNNQVTLTTSSAIEVPDQQICVLGQYYQGSGRTSTRECRWAHSGLGMTNKEFYLLDIAVTRFLNNIGTNPFR